MAGSSLDPIDERGEPQMDDDLVLIFNASGSDLTFQVPAFVDRGRALAWSTFLDTALDAPSETIEPGGTTTLVARSMKALCRRALGPGGLQAAYGAPVSTYRLQLPGLGFEGATEALDYLQELGVGGIYTSPYLRAQRGSTHGYDVVDHASLDPSLGTAQQYRAFTDGIRARGLAHLVDFVPNHVGIGTGENRWFWDVLENGASSVYADFFDIDWHPPAAGLTERVLLPVLGRQFGLEVNDGNLAVRREAGRLFVVYYERSFPAAPRSYAHVLARVLESAELRISDARRQELESIQGALTHLPVAATTGPRERAGRAREKEVTQRRIERLCAENADVAALFDAAISSINSNPEWLEGFLSAQHYRLSFWKVAAEEINYRRFFDVNELAAIRMEEPRVFAAAHAFVLDLIREGRVTGLRLDHTDGLSDPGGYLRTLQASVREALREGGLESAAPMYVLAEKILQEGEELPRVWSLSGTTGYDFLSVANGLWVDGCAEAAMTTIYSDFTGDTSSYDVTVHQSKRDVMDDSFSSEVHVLAHALKRISERSRDGMDFTLPSLTRVIKATMATFPIYRTYLKPAANAPPHDEDHIRGAIERAKRLNPRVEASIFDFLQDVLLLRLGGDAGARFSLKFQQLSGPIMAKGVEDTAHYRFNRLVCLNDVGCNPSRFGESIVAFHAHNASILARWPLSMTCTSTHDTKRSEDVRARIAVLSEAPDAWLAFLREADSHARPEKLRSGVRVAGADAYLFYQTLVGVYPFEGVDDFSGPIFAERLVAYMRKAAREAKLTTSWASPNLPLEETLEAFVRASLASDGFMSVVRAFVATVETHGASNSLAQLALRLASPGVPDIYQGTERWDMSLVDPDNRRPVDFASASAMLTRLQSAGGPSPELARSLLRDFADGSPKLYVTLLGLNLRREEPALFLEGSYEPIEGSEHVVAFTRRHGDKTLVCVAPRLSKKLAQKRGEARWPTGKAWRDEQVTWGDAGGLRNVFTGREHHGERAQLAEVLSDFPVAWLVRI